MESYSPLLCREEVLSPSPKPSFPTHLEDRGEAVGHFGLAELPILVHPCHAIEEEVSSVLEKYLQSEHKYGAIGGYLERLHSSADLCNARFRGVQWILLAGLGLSLQYKTIFSAVNYLDRFLSASRRSHNWETWMIELISVACLSVASKFEEVCHPTFAEYLQIKDLRPEHKFDPGTIKQMELLVLKALEWKLNCVTSYSYVELLEAHLCPQLTARVTDLLIHTLCGMHHTLRIVHEHTAFVSSVLFKDLKTNDTASKFVEHNPSVVAVSVLRHAVKEIAHTAWNFLSFIEQLIPVECKEQMDICSKMVEKHISMKEG
ncbi:hypothetical protein HPP92_014297 [Vanilla planifolia]|uniref:Cyclin-like domain-containing protein n=1 Tax=Vanilla planifolia TaxID=51239 RepID=A0A835QQ03_VANPL|nr:hypothetical protein HPP92_014297 [Vanilla planifolia]